MPDNINVSSFVACERVVEEVRTGKKTIVGIFQNFNFQQLPSRLMYPWFLFAQMHNLDEGKADITVNIVHDETQGVVFATGMEIPDDHPEHIDIMMEATPTEFHKAGRYVVTLNVNGHQVAYLVLTVQLPTQPLGGR